MKLQNPHDKFFKETLGNFETAKDFLTHYLPQSLFQVLDIDTLEPQKDSFINPELEENFSDLLFKVDICKQEGYLYLLFEHKSYTDQLRLGVIAVRIRLCASAKNSSPNP